MATNSPINVKPSSDKNKAAKYADRVRTGKTAKDKANKPTKAAAPTASKGMKK